MDASVVSFLQEQVALPHNHDDKPDPAYCPTWCCVRRAKELLTLMGERAPPCDPSSAQPTTKEAP